MAKIIAICNQKGGVGKTTTAVNLASALAFFNRKTLLIDIDPQGNATSGVGVDKHSLSKSIYTVLIEHSAIADAVTATQFQNLSIIPSNVDLTGFEIEVLDNPNKEYILRDIVSSIKSVYDYIIIDSPPSLGLITVNALTAADSVLVPIQCEYYALEGLSQLLSIISLVKKRINPGLAIEGVLLTMADYRTRLTTEVIEEVKRFFLSDEGISLAGGRDKVYKTIIPRSIRLSEAPGFGKPINIYDKNSIGAKQYLNLAREVLGENIPSEDLDPANIVSRQNFSVSADRGIQDISKADISPGAGSQSII